jgi:anti-sigma factor RsiW
MTEDQKMELLDLYVDDMLPTGLRVWVEDYLQSQPEAAQDVQSLRKAIARLQAAPTERPDSWFVERLLDRLLRENAEADATPALGRNANF